MDTETSDEDLVLRYCDQRDEQAFTELVRRYREPVFRLAASVLGPKFLGEAEEVAQEVFLRVHHSLPTFRRESKVGSWIYRIAYNEALNLKARSRYRVPHYSYQAGIEMLPESSTDPTYELIRDQVLSDCLVHLPEIYQSALRLYYWMEYSVEEISTLLAVPENTVKSYLHRARQLLRAMLEKKGFIDE
ncbi:MAG TPA: RNA polymerase sigma factor [Fimbriimonas sp.]|nr:RNA polymerase sigma factor [Fimbriimonas sp.]